MQSKRLRFALICLAFLFSSINYLQAAQVDPDDTQTQDQVTSDDKPFEFDATKVERFGAISMLASQKVYTVSKGTHNEQERDADGNHILDAIALEMQISWRTRKVVENKEDINVYTLNSNGEFVVTKTIKYGTDKVELTPYEYLDEDVARYKGTPDPNFDINDYLKYAKGKNLPAFRLRVQDKFRPFIESNTELVNAIKDLAKKYGYRDFELSYFKSVVTKETDENTSPEVKKANFLTKNIFKTKFWNEIYKDPKEESKQGKTTAKWKFRVGAGTCFGVYFFNSKFVDAWQNHPGSAFTFTSF